MKKRAWLCTSTFAVALMTACGGGGGSTGGGGGVIPTPTPSPLTYVAFTVTAPQGQTLAVKRRPAFTAPGGTASVTFALVSNNGTAVTGNATSFNTTGASCTPAQNPTSCTFTVQAPSGNDVFHVTTYAQANEQGSPTGAGTVTVTAASGTTTSAPTVLNGTVATIALSLPTQYYPEGDAVTLPLALVAKDANGNAIIGTYTNPITVTDTDASQQTTLSATTIPDSTTAASLTLNYLGGAMSQVAMIVASASGATESNTVTFPEPDTGYPIVNGATLTYGTALEGIGGGGSVGPTPPPSLTSPHESPTLGTETVMMWTNASFNGQNNVIDIRTQTSPSPAPAVRIDAYYQWNTTASSASLMFLGSSSVGVYTAIGDYLGGGSQTVTCVAPYQTAWVLPLPQSWNGLSGTGPCTIATSSKDGSLSGTQTLNADGSYTATMTDDLAQQATVNSDGSASGWFTYSSGGGMPPVTTDYAAYIAMSTPQPAASVAYLMTTITGPIPSPGATQTPAPVAETAPNWYLASGLTNGTVPQPLAATTYINKGTVMTLPAACAVSSTVVGTNPSYTEVDESHYQADPLGSYESDQYQYFTLNGIGIVCVTENSQVNTAGNLYLPPAVLEYAYNIYATYITASTLTAAQAVTRDRTRALRIVQLGLFAVLRAHDEATRLALPVMTKRS